LDYLDLKACRVLVDRRVPSVSLEMWDNLASLVIKAHLGQLGPPDTLARQAALALWEHLAFLVLLAILARSEVLEVRGLPVAREYQANRELLVTRDSRVLPELLAQLVRLVSKASREIRVSREIVDSLEQLEALGKLVRLEHRASLVSRVVLEQLELPDSRATMDSRASEVLEDCRVLLVSRDWPDHQATVERPVHLDHRVIRVLSGPLEHLDRLVGLVLMAMWVTLA
jgi:hypothetical protein